MLLPESLLLLDVTGAGALRAGVIIPDLAPPS
jgi:hypothetical protein